MYGNKIYRYREIFNTFKMILILIVVINNISNYNKNGVIFYYSVI